MRTQTSRARGRPCGFPDQPDAPREAGGAQLSAGAASGWCTWNLCPFSAERTAGVGRTQGQVHVAPWPPQIPLGPALTVLGRGYGARRPLPKPAPSSRLQPSGLSCHRPNVAGSRWAGGAGAPSGRSPRQQYACRPGTVPLAGQAVGTPGRRPTAGLSSCDPRRLDAALPELQNGHRGHLPPPAAPQQRGLPQALGRRMLSLDPRTRRVPGARPPALLFRPR